MHFDAKQRHDWFPKKLSKTGKEQAREMEWETAYDAEPGSDWAPPAPAKKERRAHKDLVKWQHCFRDNCSVHGWDKLDAGYISKNNTLRHGRPVCLAHLAHITSIANQDATSI